MIQNRFMLGYDYELLCTEGIKVPIYVSIMNHLMVVGGTNAGKSTTLLYWLWKIQFENIKCEYYIGDFKASHEFCGISDHYAEFEQCYELIQEFYRIFLDTAEGGDGVIKILIIDEIAGLLSHLSMSKGGKIKADEIRNILSVLSMLGRSRQIFIWLTSQRYSASIFPASSGAGDNFNVCVGLGRLTVDGRRGLFSGLELKCEKELQMGQGRGIVYIEGHPLKAIILPKISKKKLLYLLRK